MGLDHPLAFVVFASVAAITPGPSNVMLTATGAAVGLVRGVPCLLGVGTGMALMMFTMAFGLGALVLAYPLLLAALKWCGAAFLLWLAWKIATAGPSNISNGRGPVGFLGGFAFQWLNPKSWLVSTGASATYVQLDAAVLPQALQIGGLFFAVALACGLVWLAFGVVLRQVLATPRLLHVFNTCMGALLALSVLFLVW